MQMEIITRAEAKAKGLKRYFTGKPCKRGHVSERRVGGNCVDCDAQHNIDNKDRRTQYNIDNKEKLAQQSAQYRIDNKDKIAKYSSQYLIDNKDKIAKRAAQYNIDNKDRRTQYNRDNKDKIAKRAAQYYEDNKEKLAQQGAQYYEDNKERLAKRKAQYGTQYRKNNPIPVFIRNSLARILNNWKGGREKSEELCGYTIEQLTQRIESQFEDGMSWENRSEWHIDHVRPISLFIKEGVTDPSIINALSNLQPLWAKDNLSKGVKFG
jgi:hypothetical protein